MARKVEELGLGHELDEIKDLYELINPVDIAVFLRRKPHLVELLKEAHEKFEKFFPGSRLTLERHTDASEKDGDCQMSVTVYPPEQMQDISKRSRELDKDWFLKAAFKIKGDFCLDYEHHSLPAPDNLWANLIGKVEMPEDWSAETDHYIYGTPKRNSKTENA